jgi:integrating conjugative element protein (TIGR03765 family)
VVTPSLSPGRVQSRAGKYPQLSFPIFIVGFDPLSIAWLQEHQEKLKKYSALGLAVNVQTERQIGLLQKAAGGIKIAPVAGAKIAKDLSIKHYPVLVSRTMIEQ